MNSEHRIAELEKENRELKSELEQLKKEKEQENNFKQKKLLEQILNEIPVGVALHEGPEFITTIVNKGYYNFAHGKGDIMHRKVADVWPEVADQIIPLLKDVYETGKPYHATDAEFMVDRGKGPEKAWFSFSYLPFRGEKDKITGILVWSFETTAYVLNRKKAENATTKIADKEKRLRLATEAAEFGVFEWDINADRPIWENLRMYEIFGISPDEKPVTKQELDNEFLHPDDRPKFEAAMAEGMKKGAQFKFRCRIKRRNDDKWRWIEYYSKFELSPEGEPLLLIGFVADVTDTITAEETLRQSEERFRAVFAQAAVGIGLVNFQDAKWIDVNAAFCEMLGYSAEELKAISWPEITHPDDVDLDLVPFKKMAKGELENYSVEKRFIHKKGHQVWARLTLSVVRDKQEHPDYEIAVIENITERKQAEEALQRSEERWNLAIEHFAEGAVIATEDEQIIYWNPAAREMHNLTNPDEGILPLDETQKTYELWTPDGNHLLELDEWPMRRIKRGETVRDFQLRLRRPDQQWERYVSYSGSMVETANGERLIFLSIHDLTKQWESEMALRKSEERFRTMADNISQLSWMADEKGLMFWYNKRWFDYTGTTLEQMQGRGWKKVLHPEHVDRVMEKYQHALDQGERWEDIFPLRGKNARYRWFLSRAIPVTDEKGKIIRWFGTNTDVTEQRKSEKLLRNQARMLDQVQDAIIGLDNHAHITYLNEAAYDLYKIDKSTEVIGSKLGNYYSIQWDSVDSEKELYNKLEKEGTWQGENIHVTASGDKLWVESVVSAVKDEKGEITGIISAMRNVTHRKKLEEALNKQLNELQKANDLFENILYIIAHDLKGPIANMYMALNLVNSVKETGGKIKMLEVFRPMIQRVENTIKGVTGLLQVQKTDESVAVKLDFESILNDILLELKESLKPGSLDFDFRQRTIRYIEPFLTSIMKNLINNAIKYSRENAKLHIGITTETSNGYILLTVKDNGIGIDLEKHRDDLFSPFKRITPKKAEGTGVGLYIIKNIIEKNGGYIEVESTPGEGTAFYCYLKEYGRK